jgi:1-acyl-sn-glycerol-3-phosphate acyltransferase
MQVLQAVRSAVVVALLLGWLMVGGLYLRLFVYPAVWLRPGRRAALVSAYMRGMSHGILGLLRLGGARFRREGAVPTEGAVVVLMNHQSLIDIPTAVLMSRPYVPWFVTRKRYQYGMPAVSPTVRLLRCPVIEPGDRKQALAVMRAAAREQTHGLLIFPEGHRTKDGDVQAFKTAGVLLVLRERRTPVYLLVTDGFWQARRLVDFVLGVGRVRGHTEVLGPFAPPASDDDLPGFVEELRQRMIAHLAHMRRRADAA